MLIKIYRFIISPFEKLLYLLFILINIVFTEFFLLEHKPTIIIYCITFSYIISLITGIYKKTEKLFQVLFLLLYLLYNVINIYCITILNKSNFLEIVAIITNSNINESREYLASQISPFFLLQIILFIIADIILFVLARRKTLRNKYVNYTGLAFLGLSVFAILKTPINIVETSPIKILLAINTCTKKTPDLEFTYPNIIETSISHPENIIVIIGESFSKKHSSLYGYSKETNPLLKKHVDSNNLYVFNNTSTAATHTINSFQAFMGTYSPQRHFRDSWYKHTTIIEVYNTLDYMTHWISNQNRKGYYDNIPSKYSTLCKESFFCNEKKDATKYDEDVLKYINKNSGNKNLYFIHLMGQHVTFRQRYPTNYEVFNKKDYGDYPEHQQETLSDYDNATLYNDYVINSIINEFQDSEAILIYFSDHSIDIYDTNNNYCGHARDTQESEKICSEIPFMIYVSNKFKNKFETSDSIIKNNTEKHFNIDDLIYSIMDITGYKFEENEEVKQYSIFSNIQ